MPSYVRKQETKTKTKCKVRWASEDMLLEAAAGGPVIANLRLTLILLILPPCTHAPVHCPVAHSSVHHDLTCALEKSPH